MAQYSDIFHRAVKAGEIAQALFYAFIQNTWAYDMSNVRIVRDQHGDIVTIEVIVGPGENTGPGGKSAMKRHAGGWLIEFPHAAFDDRNEQVKHVLLADQNSVWAFIIMHVAVQVLFEGLVNDVAKDIKEVVQYLPRNMRPLVQHRGQFGFMEILREDSVYLDTDSEGYLKGFYSITLKDGMKVALDLAGAQYGISHVSLLPMPTYLMRWGKATKYETPFRFHHFQHMKNMNSYRDITHLTIIMELTSYFNAFITYGEKTFGQDLKDLLSLERASFQEGLAQLIFQTNQQFHDLCIDFDRGIHNNYSYEPFDPRHPKVVAQLPESTQLFELGENPYSFFFDIGDIKDFKWEVFRKFIQITGNDVKYKEKKEAKILLSQRCMHKLPGDWRVFFLDHTLPSSDVPPEFVSVNPYYSTRR